MLKMAGKYSKSEYRMVNLNCPFAVVRLMNFCIKRKVLLVAFILNYNGNAPTSNVLCILYIYTLFLPWSPNGKRHDSGRKLNKTVESIFSWLSKASRFTKREKTGKDLQRVKALISVKHRSRRTRLLTLR